MKDLMTQPGPKTFKIHTPDADSAKHLAMAAITLNKAFGLVPIEGAFVFSFEDTGNRMALPAMLLDEMKGTVSFQLGFGVGVTVSSDDQHLPSFYIDKEVPAWL